MKKIVLALTAVAALGVAGCHKNDDAANNTADVNATANEANADVNASASDAAAANASGNTVLTDNITATPGNASSDATGNSGAPTGPTPH